MTSPQTLSLEHRRTIARWAADRAEDVLDIYRAAAPTDPRMEEAIAQTRAFAAGELSVGDAIRRRGADAGSAARDAATPAARAAAYAAEQAAAVAHMGAHALGAAGYAAKARIIESGDRSDTAVMALVRVQTASMGDDIADILAALPELGTDRAGPLAPGRLSSGLVGQAIRAMQAFVNDR